MIARIEDPPHDRNKYTFQQRAGGLVAPHLQLLAVGQSRHHQHQHGHQPGCGDHGPQSSVLTTSNLFLPYLVYCVLPRY